MGYNLFTFILACCFISRYNCVMFSCYRLQYFEKKTLRMFWWLNCFLCILALKISLTMEKYKLAAFVDISRIECKLVRQTCQISATNVQVQKKIFKMFNTDVDVNTQIFIFRLPVSSMFWMQMPDKVHLLPTCMIYLHSTINKNSSIWVMPIILK